jgi:hypothetical protein
VVTPRSPAFALALLLAACSETTLSYGPDCGVEDGCGSTGMPGEDSGSTGGDGLESTSDKGPTATSHTPDPSASDDDSGVSITGMVDDGSATTEGEDAGSTTDGGDDESTSTGELLAQMYAPCTADEDCSSGYCEHGFCSAVCWSQVGGETPCPPPPPGTENVTIVCGTIGYPMQNFCEGCFDCAQYCIASCWDDSTCPDGGSCVGNLCAPEGAHCGS